MPLQAKKIAIIAADIKIPLKSIILSALDGRILVGRRIPKQIVLLEQRKPHAVANGITFREILQLVNQVSGVDTRHDGFQERIQNQARQYRQISDVGQGVGENQNFAVPVAIRQAEYPDVVAEGDNENRAGILVLVDDANFIDEQSVFHKFAVARLLERDFVKRARRHGVVALLKPIDVAVQHVSVFAERGGVGVENGNPIFTDCDYDVLVMSPVKPNPSVGCMLNHPFAAR